MTSSTIRAGATWWSVKTIPPFLTIVKSRKYRPGGNALMVASSVTRAFRATGDVMSADRNWPTACPVCAL